jgi:hypothetical protein
MIGSMTPSPGHIPKKHRRVNVTALQKRSPSAKSAPGQKATFPCLWRISAILPKADIDCL